MNNKIALNWINNQWVDNQNHKQSFNPATSEIIGTYAYGGLEEAEAAVSAAKTAFKESDWKTNRQLRYKVLNQLADQFEAYTDRLVAATMLENGKMKGEAEYEISGIVPSKFRFYAALSITEYGRALETKPGSFSMLLAEPIGVAGIITPWNSPVHLMVRSLAPALAAGCTAVIRMPKETAQLNTLISEVFASVKDLPKGVINLLTAGREAISVLVESPDVPTISFTGSTETGKLLMANGAQKLKRFGFELGGKSPMLVFNDADLDIALPTLEKALTVFAGQFCMTGSRILVQRGIAEKFIQGLSERLRNVRVGPASDLSSDMGPLIDRANVERVDQVVESAIRAGAKVLVRGGKISEGELAKGAFYKPTLLQVTDNSSSIIQDETFGPVATVQIFDTPEEAVALANDNIYGLAASVWSQDVDLPLRVGRELQSGVVWINTWGQLTDEFEEGGFKQSGIGRLNGRDALHDFIEYKHIYHKSGTL